MSSSDDNNLLTGLSKAMADAVEKAGAGTVMLNARRRFPASGILYDSDLILTASHVIEREDDVPVILADGGERTADLLGRDPGSDLAVLRLSSAVTSWSTLAPSRMNASLCGSAIALKAASSSRWVSTTSPW